MESLRAKVRALEGHLCVENDLESQIEQLSRQLRASYDTNDQLTQTMAEMETQHATAIDGIMREHAKVVQSMRTEARELSSQVEETHKERAKLHKEIKSASRYVVELEERALKANETSLHLLKAVRDLEVETAALKNYIIDLKARVAVYIPVKGDPVDNKMAEFINNYPDRNKLKLMFMRESEGTYEFGSKRVNVRVEKNKIQIRVGGGYLSIDEFLD